MITAENLTEEMIRELSRQALDTCTWRHDGIDIIEVCTIALGLPWPQPHPASGIAPTTREQARALCARILNARNALRHRMEAGHA